MKVEIKNALLQESINLLFDLSLRGKQSRHRTRFIKRLTERLKEVEEERMKLAEEYARKDDEGKPIMKKGGKEYDIPDENMPSLIKDVEELYDEVLVIEGGDNKETLETVRKILEETDKEFSGREAVIYDYLCEQFEGKGHKKESEDDD